MRANPMRSILGAGEPWVAARWLGDLFIASTLALVGACNGTKSAGAPDGSLAILIESDMMIPRDIDHIRLDVTQQGTSLLHVDTDVGPGATLIPTLYQVKATIDSSPVDVQAVGYQAGQVRVERDAITPIPTDHEGLLRLALNYLCVGDAQAGADGGVTSTCPAGLTCEQGSCQSSTVPPSSVPTYDPATVNGSALFDGGFQDASVEGGAGVGCFDVQDCFASAMPVTLDTATCSITVPAGAVGAGLNVALQLPPGGAGVCSDTDCWVVLNEGSDWTESGTTISLPPGACTSPAAKSAVTVVTTACTSKTEATPECGTWSSMPTPAVAPAPAMTGPVAPSCMEGPASQGCGNCGTQTRTCTNGMWSDWSTCTGGGACAPNATQACEESGTQTCGANCQWGACGCTGSESACGSTCVTLSTDVHNCGACGTDCTMLANVTGPTSCNGGQCAFSSSSCAAGYGDCDGNAPNGCETPLNDATHCGSCGNACTGTSTMCASGSTPACVSTCSGAVCGSSCTDPATDANNCGGCGKACPVPAHGQAICAGSSCGIMCSAGYASCGTTCSDTNSDGNNCGVCGNVCTTGSTCQGGKCTCSGVASESCGNCGTQTRTCDENGTWSSWSLCTVTVSNYGQSCGSCGGTIDCTGGCSVSTPSNYGQSCGSCGGTIGCSGACSVSTPSNYGSSCGSCGGTIACSGACSISTPSHYGQSCTPSNKCLVNGTIACSGVCSGGTAVSVPSGEVCDPGTGLLWQSPPPDAGMVNNYDLWAGDAESDAASYCAGLGMSLPTAMQLEDMLGDGLDEYMEGWFWSSTPASSGEGVAIYFDLGAVSLSPVEDFPLTLPNFVRCVGD